MSKLLGKIKRGINKDSKKVLAFSPTEENPSQITEWYTTGARLLDGIVARDQIKGIPGNRIIEIAGEEGTGKTFLSWQIAIDAQRKGCSVVYFDSENNFDPSFPESLGVDLDKVLYVRAFSVESVFSMIWKSCEIAEAEGEKILFIWDSIAMTASEADEDPNPQSTVGLIARILSKGMKRTVSILANSGSTLICLNHLKFKVGGNKYENMADPMFAPGGKSMPHSYSTRIWLYKKKTKKGRLILDNGDQIGSWVKARIYKSRFGTDNRTCEFFLQWAGGDVRIMDEESWYEFLFEKKVIRKSKGFRTMTSLDGKTEKKFRESKWMSLMKTDPEFRSLAQELVDDALLNNTVPISFEEELEGELLQLEESED